jgi:hypothetical protein
MLVAYVSVDGGASLLSIADNAPGGTDTFLFKVSRTFSALTNNGTYAFNIKGGATQVTASISGSANIFLVVAEYSGTGTNDPFNASANSGHSTGTTVRAGAMTASAGGALFCGFAANPGLGSLTITAEGGWNDRQNGSTTNGFDYEDLIGTGTQTPAWTTNVINGHFAPIGLSFTSSPTSIGVDEGEGLQCEVIQTW